MSTMPFRVYLWGRVFLSKKPQKVPLPARFTLPCAGGLWFRGCSCNLGFGPGLRMRIRIPKKRERVEASSMSRGSLPPPPPRWPLSAAPCAPKHYLTPGTASSPKSETPGQPDIGSRKKGMLLPIQTHLRSSGHFCKKPCFLCSPRPQTR